MGGGGGGEGPEDDGLHAVGQGEDEGLDALGEDGVAAVEDEDVHQAGEQEEEVEGDEEGGGGRLGGQGQGQGGGEGGQQNLDPALPGQRACCAGGGGGGRQPCGQEGGAVGLTTPLVEQQQGPSGQKL